jgi:hypothetical protein
LVDTTAGLKAVEVQLLLARDRLNAIVDVSQHLVFFGANSIIGQLAMRLFRRSPPRGHTNGLS